MQQIGQYSYAIYVLHYPMWFVFGRANILTRESFSVVPTRLGADLAHTAVLTLISILIAAVSWHAFEKRFLALRRYLPYAFERRQTATAPISRSAAAVPSTMPDAS
jgi:peptidoglycan/LPS O-acetylase OafA/YrhL